MRKFKKKGKTGLNHPILWMSGKSKNVEVAGRVLFPVPDLSRKIERDCSQGNIIIVVAKKGTQKKTKQTQMPLR